MLWIYYIKKHIIYFNIFEKIKFIDFLINMKNNLELEKYIKI